MEAGLVAPKLPAAMAQRYGKCRFWDEQTIKQGLAETLWCFPAWAS